MLQNNGYEGSADQDTDGVNNDLDECSASPTDTNVHATGKWQGCGAGQLRDLDVLDKIPDAA